MLNGLRYTPPLTTLPWKLQDRLYSSTLTILTNNWKQLHIEHPDITAIELTTSIGNIWLFNIYNDCKNNDSLDTIATYIHENQSNTKIYHQPHPSSMAQRFQPTPPHFGWATEFPPIHKMQPRASPATPWHAWQTQDENGPPTAYPNITIAQHR